MSATAEAKRKHVRADDSPILNRSTSSLSMIGRRVLELRQAWLAADEDALRGELRELAAEAERLASAPRLIETLGTRRLRIASEKDSTGRGAS